MKPVEVGMREGAEYFTAAAGAAQRRYEALRGYFLDEVPAAQVADRYGYSTASVHQMATLLRTGKLSLFAESKPGPKGPRKVTGTVRSRVLELRSGGHSIGEIAAALTGEGIPVSAQTVWQILDAEGLPRLPRRDEGRRGPPGRLDAVTAARLPGWPEHELSLPCDHAGLLLLFPAIVDLALPDLVTAAGYPSTRVLPAWASVGTLLLAKAARRARVHHIDTLTDAAAVGFTLGLTASPKATHLGTYSWRVGPRNQPETAVRPGHRAAPTRDGDRDRRVQLRLPRHLPPRPERGAGQALPAPTIPAHPGGADLLRPRPRLQRDGLRQRRHHQAEQAREIIAFADYWHAATGADPGLLVFDSQPTTYKILDELTDRGITWLTLRQRGKTELARLAALPASAWKTITVARSGRYRRPHLHEDMVKLRDVRTQVRQIAITGIGRDEPTLLITHDLHTPAKDLFTRYAERMLVENELDADIGGFHLDALSSAVPLNVDLDTTLTVVAGNLYRPLARDLPRYENATPDRIWRHFLDATGTLHVTDTGVTCALNPRSHHPVLIDAGHADLTVPIPWSNRRTPRFRFPPR